MPASSAQPPQRRRRPSIPNSPLTFNPGKARVHPDHKRVVLTTSSNAPEGPSQPSLSPENARPISTSVIRRRPANQGQPNPPNSVSASLNGSHVDGYSRTWARTTYVDYGGALWGVPFGKSKRSTEEELASALTGVHSHVDLHLSPPGSLADLGHRKSALAHLSAACKSIRISF